MNDFFFSQTPEWCKDLCDYYNVSPENALELGTRKPNRKPALPSSLTTHAVSNMTFEEIWEKSPRRNQGEIFQFYKDQGAWSAFRQVVRHKDMSNFHLSILTNILKEDSVFCEYGCGVAPFTYSLLSNINVNTKLTVYLTDVECEHLTFGFWRNQRLIERRNLKNVVLKKVPVLPDSLPTYEKRLDAVTIFEVLEHVPSPISTTKNIFSQTNDGALICENFIKHDHDGKDGPDLYSAALERSAYYNFLKENFDLLGGQGVEEAPSATRIWKKR